MVSLRVSIDGFLENKQSPKEDFQLSQESCNMNSWWLSFYKLL